MKKTLAKILGFVLSICLLTAGLVGCSGGSWNGTSMTDRGNGNIIGGFVGQTSTYVYFINGIGDSTADNQFGAPVKGSLMAAKKGDLSKAEIVVPKIFASTDYNAGIYVYGDYVYYGTPNTEKNSGGNVANDELIIMQTKYDGTESKAIVGIGALNAEFRVVEVDGNVYVVYYDSTETALISYDVENATSNVIAKTDVTVEGVGATSLANYTFLDNESVEQGYAVAYTLSVYSEEYYEDKVEEGNQRQTESYNKLCVYKPGQESAVICDGSEKELTYSINLSKEGYLFYTATDANSKTETFATDLNGNVVGNLNADLLTSNAIIKSLDEIYTLDSGKVYKAQGAKDKATEKEIVAIASSASGLIDVKDGFVYYYTTTGAIARIELNNEEAEEQMVSDDSVSKNWYAPVILSVDGKDYMFYLDNSTEGASYVEYVDINGEVKEETDEDGNHVKWYLDGQKLLGQMTSEDKAAIVDSKISALPNDFAGGKIVLEEVDGALVNEDIKEIRDLINGLDKDVKDLVSSDLLETFEKYEKAIEKANLYNELKDMRNYNVLSDGDQAAVKAIYDQVKGDIESFRNSDEYSEIVEFIDHNYLNLYQSAVEEFEE